MGYAMEWAGFREGHLGGSIFVFFRGIANNAAAVTVSRREEDTASFPSNCDIAPDGVCTIMGLVYAAARYTNEMTHTYLRRWQMGCIFLWLKGYLLGESCGFDADRVLWRRIVC